MVYASYSRGYRSGTFNGLAYGSANQVYFVKPEQVDAFEGGIKSRFWDNRAQFNISAFYYKYKRSEEHTSELQSLMRISYAVFCLKKKKDFHITHKIQYN